MGNEIEVGVNL